MNFPDLEIKNILEECTPGNIESNLGYFSKIFRIPFEGREIIVKRYHPIKYGASYILDKHNDYIKSLLEIGIKMPDTQMFITRKKNKTELIVLQEPYRKEELFRDIIQHASLEKLFDLCKMIFDDTLKFWKKMPEYVPIGFHPTLQNCAIRDRTFYFFYSFSPLNMNQKKI